MTNRIALALALLIAALLLADAAFLHWNIPILVGRATLHLVEWASFWR